MHYPVTVGYIGSNPIQIAIFKGVFMEPFIIKASLAIISSTILYSLLLFYLMKKCKKDKREREVDAKFATKYAELLYKESPRGFFKIP